MSLSEDGWRNLLGRCPPASPVTQVRNHLSTYRSINRAVLVRCTNRTDYVLKAADQSKTAVSDQIVACLAHNLEAPVPDSCVVELTQEVWEATPDLQHLKPGLLHASKWEADCSDRKELEYATEAVNRPRVAALVVLYTWMHVDRDHQFIYKNQEPRLIFSVDHGHFFPRGPVWTIGSLRAATTVRMFDPYFDSLQLSDKELLPTLLLLRDIDELLIASAVALPPTGWPVTMDERVAMCLYLEERRRAVLNLRGIR